MTLYEMRRMDREASLKEGERKGREEGLKEGLKEGEKKGLKEGQEKGWITSVLEMVQDGMIPFDTAAKKAKEKYNIDEDDFRKMLDSFQKNIS